MFSRLKIFRSICMRRGYELLRDDYLFIDRILSNMPKNDFKAILARYLEEWGAGMDNAVIYDTAQGYGRRRANSWLLEYSSEFNNKNIVKEAVKNVMNTYNCAINNLKEK